MPAREPFATLAYLAPFDDTQIAQFAQNWYAERESDPDKACEGAEHLVQALVVARDRAVARLVEDGRVGEQLSQGVHVGGVERLIASADQFLVGVCHGPLLPR